MRISQECDYAFRIILYFATRELGFKADAKAVVEEQHIPLRFALKIFRKLCEAKIMKSFRGVHGGYSLLATPADITFYHVIEAIDGPIYINKCLRPDGECSRNAQSHCPMHDKLMILQEGFTKALDDVTFLSIVS